jgi:hypothetical protein
MGYAERMRFGPDELALLKAAEEIEIETARPGGPSHRTIIWIVVDGDDVFLRSVNGASARWYREATENPSVAIHVDGQALPARTEPATDAESIRRTSDELRRKYATHGASLRSMLVPDILDTTLRVEPA